MARNAHFNIVKLAADPVEYLPNFYGDMADAINGNDDSDRVLVHWRVGDPAVAAAAVGRPAARDGPAAGAVVALGTSADGRPQPGTGRGRARLGRRARRHRGAALVPARGGAGEWRVAVRETLGGLLGEGGRVVGFDRTRGYVVERHPD